ncbi:MAG: hypothetical protein IJP98_01050 [Clostridia bacterium]|nr:hypothetical protein [Clostridia bacterium]
MSTIIFEIREFRGKVAQNRFAKLSEQFGYLYRIAVYDCTVTWKNGDTVVKTDTLVCGTQPKYEGASVKKNDEDFLYTFTGWNDGTTTYAPDELPILTGDVTYTAVFTSTAKYEAGYYIVGNMNDWKPNTAYQLTRNEGATGVTEYMFNGLSLTTSSEFKVVYAAPNAENPGATRTWFPNWGDNYGRNGEITANGVYNVYFRPDYNGDGSWFNNCIYVSTVSVSKVTFLGAGLQRRVLNETGEIIDYATNIRFGFEFDLPEGAVIDTDQSYFRWSLYNAATADNGNRINIRNVDNSGEKPVVNMVITGVPKDYYTANITCFIHLVYTVGNDTFTEEQGGFVRSVEQVCNGLINDAGTLDVWKTYAQSLLDAIPA